MTREEAIGNLLRHLRYTVDSTDALIKALEQEPCDDCISRQAVLDVIEREQFKGDAISEIEKLPPVTPQQKTGHWIAVYQGDEIINYRCTECEFGNTFGKSTYRMNYCPNCGAKMIEEE